LNSRSCGNLVKFNWLDALALPITSGVGNDGYATVSLPFTFNFGDQTYDNVTVSANGYLTFGVMAASAIISLFPVLPAE